ncbi:MAG: HlyD family efflux transporter periplasmic adaptor subunit [Planctomycetes bacterium]|nr:HlyD family efflux transporter periplasmic adaptor subunit [Planctomycetota bacterium]
MNSIINFFISTSWIYSSHNGFRIKPEIKLSEYSPQRLLTGFSIFNSKPKIRRGICIVLLFVGISLMVGCGKKKEIKKTPSPRPVTVLELRESNPVKPLQLTGSVKSWKDEDISFEVDGRLGWIVEMGTNLEGRWEEDGVVRVPGDILARIDERRYNIRLKRAKAERDRADAEYVRKKSAWEKRAISEVDFIRGTADRDAKEAEFEYADYDLEKCTLYAPFAGEVSEVYVEAGGYVKRGDPVAHLVMMDPIKIDISVSSATSERLKIRDAVRIFLPEDEDPVYGIVYEKSTVADPKTRTFRVSIITRNIRTVGGLAPDNPLLNHPLITDFTHLFRMREGDKDSPFVVEENRSLRKEGEGYYVWAAPEHKLGDKIDKDNPLITLHKFNVTPGERRMNLQGLYLMRELSDIGELAPGTLIAMDVPDGFKDGDEVLISRNQWRLRPGQLIPVLLGVSVPVTGLYLPMNSIKPVDEKVGEIFLAIDGKATKVRVKILDNVGELFRLEALDPNEANLVKAGAKVIIDHIHFLQNEEPIQVIKLVEQRP